VSTCQHRLVRISFQDWAAFTESNSSLRTEGLAALTLTLLATHVLLPPGILTEFTHVKLLIRRVEIGALIPALRYCNFFSVNSVSLHPSLLGLGIRILRA
jgi:hypothetical protein